MDLKWSHESSNFLNDRMNVGNHLTEPFDCPEDTWIQSNEETNGTEVLVWFPDPFFQDLPAILAHPRRCPSPRLFSLAQDLLWPLFLGGAWVRRPGPPPAHVQGPAFPQQEMPGLKWAAHAPDQPRLQFNPLTWVCLPNSNDSKRLHKGPGFDQRESQNFPAVTMALFTHSREARVLQSSEEKGLFDVSLAKNWWSKISPQQFH